MNTQDVSHKSPSLDAEIARLFGSKTKEVSAQTPMGEHRPTSSRIGMNGRPILTLRR